MGSAYGNSREIIPVVIPTGATGLPVDPVNLGARTLVGIIMPAAWTAADLSFQVLVDEVNPGGNSPNPTRTYAELVDSSGANMAITAPAQGEYVAIAPTAAFTGLGRIRVRSGTASVPVNQAADRTLRLVVV